MIWILLGCAAVLVATSLLSALNLALMQASESALQRRLDDAGRSAAGQWLFERWAQVDHAVSFLRTWGRVGFYALVMMGTRNLLFLAGPILDILQKGLTLVVDELDNSLHTLLVRDLIRLFHHSETNTANAQLLFTTHDTALLDAYGLFRRDQIWFVEKENDQNSKLYCLLDFSPRKNEALERGYLQGRYGSVPILKPLIDAKN